jgi:DNA-binding protein H-NS
MAINLKGLSPKELKALIDGAHAQMEEARSSQIRTVREKIEGLLKSSGLSLDEVYPTRHGKTSKGAKKFTVAPKYRNPANPEQTWSGRGHQPLWMVAALKKRGVSMASFLIGGSAGKAETTKRSTVKKVPAKKSMKK